MMQAAKHGPLRHPVAGGKLVSVVVRRCAGRGSGSGWNGHRVAVGISHENGRALKAVARAEVPEA